MPHPVVGSAADPIALEPVDDVVVTTLVDNIYDALLTDDNTITRAPLAAGTAQAPQFEPGFTNVGLMAEHGFSALVTVRRGDTTTSVLFDTELSPDAMVTNADRLGLALPGGGADDWPTLSKRALTGEGFDVIERSRRRATRQLGPRQQRHPLPACR
jgi:7,8-dihydropterin-6-yl-methyl-4-(beta-D-ribofuranosyl)aminobenzene 5'-phosphate synthase